MGVLELSQEQVRIATGGFSEASLLGSGGFGKVYIGTLFGLKVAVKKISDFDGTQEFEKEVNSLQEMRHPHILQLIGWAPSCMCLVSEYMAGGSLHAWLRDAAKRRALTWKDRIRICREMASAICYMHAREVLHLDLKPANILLDSHKVSKVGDLGLATLCGGSSEFPVSKLRGTAGYMDPEMLSKGQVSKQTDTYAFGLIMLQLLTGMTRIEDLHGLLGELEGGIQGEQRLNNFLRSLSLASESKSFSSEVSLPSCVREPSSPHSNPTFSSDRNLSTSHSMTWHAELHPDRNSNPNSNLSLSNNDRLPSSLNRTPCSTSRWSESSTEFESTIQKLLKRLDPEAGDWPIERLQLAVGLALLCTERKRELRPRMDEHILTVLQELDESFQNDGIGRGNGNNAGNDEANASSNSQSFEADVLQDPSCKKDLSRSASKGFAEWFKEAVDLEHPEALFKVGECFYEGKGTAQSFEVAVEWFKRAVTKRHLPAFHMLGKCYLNGKGVERDENKGVTLCTYAAQSGWCPAQYTLAHCYANGRGVVKSESEAFKWYGWAAHQGHPESQHEYASICLKQKNYEVALQFLYKAAVQGYGDSQYALGMQLKGNKKKGEDQLSQAIRWLECAASHGHVQAQFQLGRMFAVGSQVDKNMETAAKWYGMAAQNGHVGSQIEYGWFCEKGIGVEVDFKKAETLYCLAAASPEGSGPATEMLAGLRKRVAKEQSSGMERRKRGGWL